MLVYRVTDRLQFVRLCRARCSLGPRGITFCTPQTSSKTGTSPRAEVLWWLCIYWLCKRWTGGRILMSVRWFWGKSPVAECGKDQGDGGGFWRKEDGETAHMYSGEGCWRDGGIQVPGQMEDQYWGCQKETNRLFSFPEETERLAQSNVENILPVCCGSLPGERHRRWNEVIERTGSVIGCKPYTFEAAAQRRILNILLSITDNSKHALHSLLDRKQSTLSDRLIQIQHCCHKDCYKKSLLPTAVTLYNSAPSSGRELLAL